MAIAAASQRTPSRQQYSTVEGTQPARQHGANEGTAISGAADDWQMSGRVDQRRVRLLTVDVKSPRASEGRSVVCYLQRDLRVQDNWALLLAGDAAASLHLPLHVVHLLVPTLGFQPTPRHLHFFYGGAREVQEELSSLNVGFHVPVVTSNLTDGKLKEANTKIKEIQAALQPAAVVCDFFPLRLATKLVDVLTEVCAHNKVPLYQVDAHSVVPTWVASNRLEVAARTLRPRLHLLLREFSTSFPVLSKHAYPPLTSTATSASRRSRSSSATSDSSASSALAHALPSEEKLRELLHADGPGVVEKWTPGTKAGLQRLRLFFSPQNVCHYEKHRNDPVAEIQSNLSPYLHFGQISQQRCLLEALLLKKLGGVIKQDNGGGINRNPTAPSSATVQDDNGGRGVHANGRNSHRSTMAQNRVSGGNMDKSAGSNRKRVRGEDGNGSRACRNLVGRSSSVRCHDRPDRGSQKTLNAISEGVSRKDVITGVDAFLEEAIVRCALSENFVFYAGDRYDKIEGAPRWAQESLRKHEKDPRVPLYDIRVLEAAETYDAIWNAAQQQLMQEGKMHGYLRMYWAKKMLEWMKTPAEALAGALYLNDKYSLDGTDPNGYAGCLWSIAALHDQPFMERPIYGKVRYMNYKGCQRKFNVDAFLQLYKASGGKSTVSTGERDTGDNSKKESGRVKKKIKTSPTEGGEGGALGIEAQMKAEKGAERLGMALLTTTPEEQRQQRGVPPVPDDEEEAVKTELEQPQPTKKATKRERTRLKKEEELHDKQKGPQKQETKGMHGTPRRGMKSAVQPEEQTGTAKRRAKMEQQHK